MLTGRGNTGKRGLPHCHTKQKKPRKHFVKYLITGGAGFIGSHLAEQLLTRGHEVAVVDDLSTGNMGNLENVIEHPRFRFLHGSVEDESDIGALIAWSDTVFHLAAAVGVELVVKQPVHTIETNVHGTENVLHYADVCGSKVIVASTSEVYGRSDKDVFAETDDLLIGPPTHSRWSYAVSKALDEFLALSYYKEKKLPTIVVRFFNTVGPRQTGQYGMVLPRFVNAAVRGLPLTVFGDGEQSRCFCHVDDTVAALLALDEQPEALGQVFNIGSRESITINELARQVLDVTGGTSEIRHIPYDEAYESGFEDMRRRVPCTQKIRTLTGWEPRKDLAQIIVEVEAFIKSRLNT